MRRIDTQKIKSKTEHNTKKKLMIILLLLIVTIAIICLLLRVCTGDLLSKYPTAAPVYLEDEGSSIEGEAKMKEREEILKELEKQQLVVTDKLSSNITFPLGDIGTIGEWIVENPKENNIIQQAEVYLDNRLIVKSTPIYPDQHITAIELLEEIVSGEYEVIAYINYYDIETKEFISKAGYKIHLTVK